MPTSEGDKRENGNAIAGLRAKFGGQHVCVEGRGGGQLPIYIVPFGALDRYMNNLRTVLDSPDAHLQPTYHRDDDENLPDAPPADGHPELHVPDNGFPNPGLIRLVVDRPAQRLFLTPTHYEGWSDGGGARNPFFLVRGAPAIPFAYVENI